MEENFVGPAPMAGTTGLKTLLRVNNQVISLTPFVQKYIAGVLCGILKSLGEYPNFGMKAFGGDLKVLTICIEPDDLRIYADELEVDIRKTFTRLLIKRTIKGMLSALDGVFAGTYITIHVDCKD